MNDVNDFCRPTFFIISLARHSLSFHFNCRFVHWLSLVLNFLFFAVLACAFMDNFLINNKIQCLKIEHKGFKAIFTFNKVVYERRKLY